VVGINSRLDTFQAAVLNVKLAVLDESNRQRQHNAARYHQLFSDAGLDQWLELPSALPQQDHVWNQYTIRVPGGRRDALRAWLADARIGTEIYYPVPLHQQECFGALGYTLGSLPETDRAAAEVLSLPIFPELTEEQLQAVVHRIASFYEDRVRAAA
jgi:dTDP-4-amino-4,6-dideoxygalactose transaminase